MRLRQERARGQAVLMELTSFCERIRARLNTASIADQFDAVMHIDHTRALEPLELWARHESDLPETYPSAL